MHIRIAYMWLCSFQKIKLEVAISEKGRHMKNVVEVKLIIELFFLPNPQSVMTYSSSCTVRHLWQQHWAYSQAVGTLQKVMNLSRAG